MALVNEFFHLNEDATEELYTWKPSFGFNGYGEIIFRRTFSRKKPDGSLESWNDCCLRVINGIMSIRKNHYCRNNIEWNDGYWQQYAAEMVRSMFVMEWLPPGRGLWQCGTQFMYERGSAALNNCGFVEVTMETMASDMAWAADMCMLGVGIGFRLNRSSVRTEVHVPRRSFLYSVPDTREGWANSIRLLIRAYLNGADNPDFDYSQLRKENSLIRGFGGTASGPGPLVELHNRIRKEFGRYITGAIDEIELQANIANAIAVCVLAGNVRRSAEILQCEIEDRTFIELKNGAAKPDRLDISWTSNNSGIFTTKASFNLIGDIASRVVERGEPGGINQMNMIYGRLNPKDIMAVEHGQIRKDKARGFNPCGEQQLENRELCCLVNTFPTKCMRDGRFQEHAWHRALDFATFYASTVTLLPTHDATTNAVMQRNRRIGVAVSDFTGWVHAEKLHNVIDYLKSGYKLVRERNAALADDAGIPHSIRLTTIKPDGTITKLAGVTAGAGYPTFRHTLRRTRFPKVSPITKALIDAGVPWEPDVMQPDTTLVFEYPILQGPAPPVSEVSIWEQVTNIIILQRYWSDNAVSNTIYFEPDEYLAERVDSFVGYSNEELDKIQFHKGDYVGGIMRRIEHVRDNKGKVIESLIYAKNVRTETRLIEHVISAMMPMVKSFSLLPKSGPGVYPQMPESELTEEEYHTRLAAIKPIDWNKVSDNEAIGVKFCSGDECEIIRPTMGEISNPR